MTDQQRVTDEQLSDWANWGPGMVPPGLFVGVVADLRASRAREAELRGLYDGWHAKAMEAERGRAGLQQRIDKALAACDKVEPEALPLFVRAALKDAFRDADRA